MRGHTLIELIFVLLVAGVTATSLAPAARQYRDRASVVAAREVVVGLLAEARLAAVEAGVGSVLVTSEPWTVTSLAGDSTLRSVALGPEFGVSLVVGGGRPDIELVYDALGLGRVASQSLVFRRGRASAELIVSSYGRVRRR